MQSEPQHDLPFQGIYPQDEEERVQRTRNQSEGAMNWRRLGGSRSPVGPWVKC